MDHAGAATGVEIIGVASRYRTALILLQHAFAQARELHLADYLGDVAL